MTQSDQPIIKTPSNGALEFAIAAAELAYNTRCVDVIVLDLRGRSPVTEFFVIATGTSPRQMRTAVEELQDLGKKMGFAPWKTSGLESGNWILLDCVHVVCHLFDGDGRAFYDLELLWGDCPKIDWRKELGLPPIPDRQPLPAESGAFSEESYLDQIAAQEEEERELTELEDDQDADEDADVEPSVVVELPDEDAVSELVEIDPPSTRSKREHALYPTKITEQNHTEEEAAMHVVPTRDAAEVLDEEEPTPEPKKPARRKKAVKKPAVKKVTKRKPAVKKSVKSEVKKKMPAKKPAVKKKPASKKKPAVRKKLVAARSTKKLVARKPTKKTAKKPAAKKKR